MTTKTKIQLGVAAIGTALIIASGQPIREGAVFGVICGACLYLLVRAGWHLREIVRMVRTPPPRFVPLGWKCPWCRAEMVRDQFTLRDQCSNYGQGCRFTTAGRVHWTDPV